MYASRQRLLIVMPPFGDFTQRRGHISCIAEKFVDDGMPQPAGTLKRSRAGSRCWTIS